MTRRTKNVPKMTTGAQAERFLAKDLSGLDFAQFKPAAFEFDAKSERVNMRLPIPRLNAVKETASRKGVPYRRFIREVLERAVDTGKKARP